MFDPIRPVLSMQAVHGMEKRNSLPKYGTYQYQGKSVSIVLIAPGERRSTSWTRIKSFTSKVSNQVL